MKLENKPKYLKYSGVSVTMNLNPLHWALVPYARKITTREWPDCDIWDASAGWLCFTVRVWIDSGQW